MIKISPFTPLFFDTSTDEYGVDSRYMQVFAATDTIVVEVVTSENETVSGMVVNAVTDEVMNMIFTSVNVGTVNYYYARVSGLKEGCYFANVCGKKSELFQIASGSELEGTTLIQYTNSVNTMRTDVIFNNGNDQIVFDFRVHGGFKDDDWSFAVNNEQFEIADGNVIEMFAVESTQKSFTMGTSSGCPIWYGEHLNRILCCNNVHFNGKRYVRKSNSVPEVMKMIDGQKSYVFKVQLQGMVENIDVELPSSEGSEMSGGGEGFVYLIKLNDNVNPTDANTFSALRILLEIDKCVKSAIDGLGNTKFIRKDIPDTTNAILTFLKGLKIGTGDSGLMVLDDGTTQAVVDRLHVNIKAYFEELEVQKKTHIGGSSILSHAGMKCIRIDEFADAYRCYLKSEEDGVEVQNTFTVGSLAYMQEDNIIDSVTRGSGNRMFWREVLGTGADYIDLSKRSCLKGSDAPSVGDDIIGLGHRTDPDRQSAIFMNSVGKDSPSIIFYQGINDFSLEGREVIEMKYDMSKKHAVMNVYGDFYVGDKGDNPSSYIRYTKEKGLEIKGSMHLEEGSTGASNLRDLPDEISRAVQLGTVNLIRNSGFTGSYESSEVDPETDVQNTTEMFSAKLEHWGGMATVGEDPESASGKNAIIGSLTQSVQLIVGERYVLSFKAKGANVAVSCGTYNINQTLEAGYKKYIFKFTFDGTGILLLSGTATICDLQLERGTIATDWSPSPLDNDKTQAEFKMLQYIRDAMKDGSVDVLGGLVLASMIQLGNYSGGKLNKVTAGISGIYNDDEDVAVWAGGNFEQAIRTITKFSENPGYEPTDEEWKDLANFVVSHGGDAFFRGYIFAKGGYFRGKIETSAFGNRIVIDPVSNAIKMFNEDNLEIASINFVKAGENWHFGEMNLTRYNGDTKQKTFTCNLAGDRVTMENFIDKNITYFSPEGVEMVGVSSDGVSQYRGHVKFHKEAGYPLGSPSSFLLRIGTSVKDGASCFPGRDEAAPGELYLDGDILKIKR